MGLSAGCCTHAFAVLNKRSLVAKVEIPPEMAKKTRAMFLLLYFAPKALDMQANGIEKHRFLMFFFLI